MGRALAVTGTVVLAACLNLAQVAANAATRPMATTAMTGTDIGNAVTVSKPVKGSVTKSFTQAWYVMYPTTIGGTVVARVTDTTPSAHNCQDISTTMTDADGATLASSEVTPTAPFTSDLSREGSAEYYVEVNTYGGCAPQVKEASTFTVSAVSGAGGTAPDPSAGSIAAATTIGTVGSELQGHTLYSGTVPSTTSEEWYQLYKADDTTTATIRVADTTLNGSAICPDIQVSLDNDNGATVGSVADLGDNTATLFSVPNTGQYFLEASSYNPGNSPCGSSSSAGAAYTIEPEPSAEWTSGPTPPTAGKTSPAASMAAVTTPLLGHRLYQGTVPSTTTEDWYELFKADDTKTATIRVADRTVNGSAVCPDIQASLDNSEGSTVGSVADLGDNTATTFLVPNTGRYFLEVTSYNPGNSSCGSSSSAGAAYTVEPEPSAEWTAAPAATGSVTP
jgi:hypothetical protein